MSNYPEGVSGLEDEIAGPLTESEDIDEKECQQCEWKGLVPVLTLTWRFHQTEEWTCRECGMHYEDDIEQDEADEIGDTWVDDHDRYLDSIEWAGQDD